MRWYEITVHTTEEAIEAISNFMNELGAGGVSIEESGTLNKERDTSFGQWYEMPLNDIPEGRAIIKGYYPEETKMDEIMASLKCSIEELEVIGIDSGEPSLDLQIVNDEDWADAWKQYFKPLRVSNRLTVKPTWEEYTPAEEEIILELDPGMAFGTGTHATTALCLQTLEDVIRAGDDVIDVGTGSGILAIAAAKLGAKHVLALDLDPVSVSSAKENTRLNALQDSITIQLSDLLGVLQSDEANRSGLGVEIPVQAVVANILAEIILLFLDDVYNVLQSGGHYIASGIIKSKEEDVAQGLTNAGFTITDRRYEGEWVVFVARKG